MRTLAPSRWPRPSASRRMRPSTPNRPRRNSCRRQIEVLERQLADVEVTSELRDRVAEIGGTARGRKARRPRRAAVRSGRSVRRRSALHRALPRRAGKRFRAAVLDSRGHRRGSGRRHGRWHDGRHGRRDVQRARRRRALPIAEQNVLAQHASSGDEHGPVATFGGLISAITSTIDPTSWDEVGGPGSIAQLGYALLVSTTPANHEKIEKLLETFRGRWGTLRTISVRAWWLWLDNAQTDKLLGNEADPAGQAGPLFGLVEPALGATADEGRSGAGQADERGYRQAITCYNGQTVSAQEARQSIAVTARRADPRRHRQRGQTDDDRLPAQDDGLAGRDHAASDAGGQHQRQIRDPGRAQAGSAGSRGPAANPADHAADADKAGPRDLAAAIDRPQLATQELSTTLRLPIDRVMLIGGMTFPEAAPAAGSHLLLFVRASVQELRDDNVPKTVVPPPANAEQKTPTESP